ncbi:MAG TPA: lipid-binding SYLF domain-containing protein [Steroidobacteraceae bacterium]|jgi:lipid-binding SYLF domain-containing protein|nr:lipid-binding SYLF domain-containing protein [Steroidobacteraceae bacterium]
MPNRNTSARALIAVLLAGVVVNIAAAGAREESLLLTATEVLQEVKAMPDVRLPDTLLAHAYGIAVIPDVGKFAFIFGGRHGTGVLAVRDKLTSPWSNPAFVSLSGGSWGFQAGVQYSDIILVFTTKRGIEGIAGGKLTLGADASVAAGPVGRQGSAATDVSLAEIYSYARTRGLFGGIALDGTVISISRKSNAALYNKSDVTATEIFSGQAPTPPSTAQRFLDELAKATGTAVRASPAPQAEVSAAQTPASVPPSAQPARTYPLEEQKRQ